MKRSEINKAIREAEELFAEYRFVLPEFGTWSFHQMRERIQSPDYSIIKDRRLGWDVTDFGSESFPDTGLTLFTLRNGQIGTGCAYAEKVMKVNNGQVTPWHFHWAKTEDIINRNGGNLVVELQSSDISDAPYGFKEDLPDGEFSANQTEYVLDGRKLLAEPGEKIILRKGQSIRLFPTVYHKFYGEGGDVLVGEVSMANDDVRDNRFKDRLPRFSPITKDTVPFRMLCSEY